MFEIAQSRLILFFLTAFAALFIKKDHHSSLVDQTKMDHVITETSIEINNQVKKGIYMDGLRRLEQSMHDEREL